VSLTAAIGLLAFVARTRRVRQVRLASAVS
jgi:hypothetical protein